MRITTLLAGAAVATAFALPASASVIYQSIPDLTVPNQNEAYCSQCGGDGQDIGQAFTLANAAVATSASFDVQSDYVWPTSVDFSIFQNNGGVLGANLYAHTFSSFVSDVSTGFGTDVVTVNLGSVSLAAGSYYLFLTNAASLGIPTYSGGADGAVVVFNSGSPPSSGNGVSQISAFLGHSEDIGVSLSSGGAVPEPAAWALMLTGFMGAGAALRANRRRVAVAA